MYSRKKKVFTLILSRISCYRLFCQVYMFDKFCYIVADRLYSHHGPLLRNPALVCSIVVRVGVQVLNKSIKVTNEKRLESFCLLI